MSFVSSVYVHNSIPVALSLIHISSLLEEKGVVSIIIPAEAEKTVVDTAWNHKLFPLHRVQVFTKPGKPCRRVLDVYKRQGNYFGLCMESDSKAGNSQHGQVVGTVAYSNSPVCLLYTSREGIFTGKISTFVPFNYTRQE